MRKLEMREKEITYCDYCKKEIKDSNWTGDRDKDFHSMKVAGELGDVKETCEDKYKKQLNDAPHAKVEGEEQ